MKIQLTIMTLILGGVHFLLSFIVAYIPVGSVAVVLLQPVLWLTTLWPSNIPSSVEFILLAINSIFWGAILSLLLYAPVFLKRRGADSKSIDEDA